MLGRSKKVPATAAAESPPATVAEPPATETAAAVTEPPAADAAKVVPGPSVAAGPDAAVAIAPEARSSPPAPPVSEPPAATTSELPAPPPLRRDVLELGIDQVRHVEPKLDARSSLYRPDTVVDGGTAQGLTVRAAAVRGRAKRYHGKSREDDFCLQASSARRALVVAVADGMGAAARAGLGAALAVRHAVEAVEEQLSECAPDALDWPKIFNRAAAALVVEHRRQGGAESYDRPDRDETRAVSRDLGTTLTVAVIEAAGAGQARASIAAIGDSPAYRLAGGAYELLVGERETDEDFSTSTVVALPYLPQPEVRDIQLGAAEVLLVCTDGFSEPLAAGNSDVGRLFARELTVPPPLALWPYLVDFAKATYDDDRTLVAVWPAELSADDRGAEPADGD
jgi:serine/threonine protein phosphatase PrpC